MNLHLAAFRFDVTPPLGHSCCGGWIPPISVVDDPMEAAGIVLLGPEAPIVLCAVDWTGIGNSAHVLWRQALADAAHTTPERVALHVVHQHNAPLACLDTQRIVAEQGDLPAVVDVDFFHRCVERSRTAVTEALRRTRPVTHVGTGQAAVKMVASNRRLLGPDGKVQFSRTSSCRDEKIRALPEGLIDPNLKTIAFFQNDAKLASLHYYATHPMSYYGDGRATSDFPGLARKERQRQEPNTLHVYFTGCAGNVTAGKYNDGSKETRPVLVERMLRGIVESEQKLERSPIRSLSWRFQEILPARRAEFAPAAIRKQIANRAGSIVSRNRPAYTLAWFERLERKVPIVLSALHINETSVLHLPSECFVEYQLKAQELAKDRFVAVAAYGDGGPWYIPVAAAYPQGGYEVSVAFCDPGIEQILTKGMRQLLAS